MGGISRSSLTGQPVRPRSTRPPRSRRQADPSLSRRLAPGQASGMPVCRASSAPLGRHPPLDCHPTCHVIPRWLFRRRIRLRGVMRLRDDWDGPSFVSPPLRHGVRAWHDTLRCHVVPFVATSPSGHPPEPALSPKHAHAAKDALPRRLGQATFRYSAASPRAARSA